MRRIGEVEDQLDCATQWTNYRKISTYKPALNCQYNQKKFMADYYQVI